MDQKQTTDLGLGGSSFNQTTFLSSSHPMSPRQTTTNMDETETTEYGLGETLFNLTTIRSRSTHFLVPKQTGTSMDPKETTATSLRGSTFRETTILSRSTRLMTTHHAQGMRHNLIYKYFEFTDYFNNLMRITYTISYLTYTSKFS